MRWSLLLRNELYTPRKISADYCKSERTITEDSRKNWRRPVDGKTRQSRSANRGVLWTRLTARAGHARAVGCKRGVGREEGTQCHPKIEGEKEGSCARTRAWARGEGGCRTRRRLDAISVDIYLLQHEKVTRKRRWYVKEKSHRSEGQSVQTEDDRMPTLFSIRSFRGSKWK